MLVGTRSNILPVVRQVARPLSIFFFIAVIVSYVNQIDHPFKVFAIPEMTVSILGSALGLLLGFRTNAAYDRWWEARKIWGSLVNSSRTLARQAISFTKNTPCDRNAEAEQARQVLIYFQIAFVHALRCALRKQEPWQEITSTLDPVFLLELRNQSNVPAAILQRMGEFASNVCAAGLISEWNLQRLDSTFTDVSNSQGACERIKNTPLPREYDIHPELLIKAYCLLLPLVLVDELKILTPLVTLVISFAFLVLNQIGRNLEDPFENRIYDTPLTSLSVTIEINLRQALGESKLPNPVVPINGILW